MGEKQVYNIEEGRQLLAGEGKRLKAEKRGHPESEIQQGCVKWFKAQYPRHNKLLFAIPNGGARSKVEAKIMMGEGVVPGAADLMLAIPQYSDGKIKYHGLFIEMKAGVNSMTSFQREFCNAVAVQGYQYTVCRSVDQFMGLITEYLK